MSTAFAWNATAAANGRPLPNLLQQMRLVLNGWRAPAGASTASGSPTQEDYDDDARLANLETARGVLKLYAASSGPYEPTLSALHEFILGACEFYRETASADAADAVPLRSRAVALKLIGGGPDDVTEAPPAEDEALSSVDRSDPKSDRAAYAMVRVERTETQMRELAADARTRETQLQDRIAKLINDNKRLEGLLQFQIERFKKRENRAERVKLDDIDKEIEGVELARRLDQEQQRVRDRDDEIGKLTDRIGGLLSLNGMYARQVVELGARIQVYAEQNDKFATLLSLQHDEKINTDKENELLRAELLEMHKFHQLRDSLEGEAATVAQTIELRGVRMGRGANGGVPRHLQYKGLMNRITVPKEAAVSIVSDLLIQRHAGSSEGQRREFSNFVHQQLTKKHNVDAIAWAYSLDEATQFFDGDCNLNLFGLVSRRQLCEHVYRDISTDVQMLMEGCEVMDQLQHGDIRLSVPVKHVLGLLVEMYPSYPDAAFRRIVEFLQQSLTSTGHAHYRMLFPNLEREELTQGVETTFSTVELRKETMFSSTFKELLIDDACVSMQAIEDVIMDLPQDMVTLTHILNATQSLYESDDVTAEVHAGIRAVILEHLGSTGAYEVTLSKWTAVHILRTKLVVRRGAFRFDSTLPGAVRTPILMQQTVKGELRRTMEELCVPINYLDVLQKLKHRRFTYREVERDKQDAMDAAAAAASPFGVM